MPIKSHSVRPKLSRSLSGRTLRRSDSKRNMGSNSSSHRRRLKGDDDFLNRSNGSFRDSRSSGLDSSIHRRARARSDMRASIETKEKEGTSLSNKSKHRNVDSFLDKNAERRPRRNSSMSVGGPNRRLPRRCKSNDEKELFCM